MQLAAVAAALKSDSAIHSRANAMMEAKAKVMLLTLKQAKPRRYLLNLQIEIHRAERTTTRIFGQEKTIQSGDAV